MSDYTDALRKLADFIETADYDTPDSYGDSVRFNTEQNSLNIHMPYFLAANLQKSALRKIIRAFGGTWEKQFSGTSLYFNQEKVFGHFSATIFTKRDAVCERVVKGTEMVVHARVDAIAEYTETREIIEWECGTLLADKEEVTV